MDIFNQLGINTTAAFQFMFFCVALTFLSKVVFGPYAHALEERQRRTKGGEDLALEFQSKSVELNTSYETKMRELNNEIKAIVDSAKTQANKDYETAINAVRTESEKAVQTNRTQLTSAVQAASQDLKTQTTSVALAITNKLLK